MVRSAGQDGLKDFFVGVLDLITGRVPSVWPGEVIVFRPMNLQDRVRIFHEPDCAGIIISQELDSGILLKCAECGNTAGAIEPAILSQILDFIPGSQSDLPST